MRRHGKLHAVQTRQMPQCSRQQAECTGTRASTRPACTYMQSHVQRTFASSRGRRHVHASNAGHLYCLSCTGHLSHTCSCTICTGHLDRTHVQASNAGHLCPLQAHSSRAPTFFRGTKRQIQAQPIVAHWPVVLHGMLWLRLWLP